ncbi:MAG: 50S ribosomal protein L4 [Xanthobacteraceae bacterium]|nr:50S ribosomal protein L4 [Xanthobacteraceae bacterium]QYK43913.1 MAG: 50S ribosomal protein L4 [Xanthobacteraceae bacterium]
MELSIVSLDGKKGESVKLDDAIFGLEVRADLLHRVVNWQLNKRRAGTHKVKNRAEIWRTGKKMYGQKGTGNARHGSARVPQFRGGGRAFGPVVRSHETELPKKLRQLALKHALSAKAKESAIVVLSEATLKEPKTKTLAKNFADLGFSNALVIGGAEIEKNFGLAARNLREVDVLPVQGINVYDIMRRQKLVLTKAALDALEARFK